MAPTLAIRRCVPEDVARRLVGYTSVTMSMLSLQQGTETAVNRQSIATTNTSDVAMYRRKTDTAQANIENAEKW